MWNVTAYDLVYGLDFAIKRAECGKQEELEILMEKGLYMYLCT